MAEYEAFQFLNEAALRISDSLLKIIQIAIDNLPKVWHIMQAPRETRCKCTLTTEKAELLQFC
jgi:hypothetical protein